MPATPQKPRVTLRDIARLAAVSVACVSLALRNSPRISREKRDRIDVICRQLGYVRDGRLGELMSHLRTLDRRPRGATLGVVISGSEPLEDEPHPEVPREQIIEALRSEATAKGYGMDVFDLQREGLSARRLRQILLARGISGVVVLPADRHPELASFNHDGLCVVGLGYELDAPAPHRVCANYLKMADALMRAAIEAGHRHIGFIPEQSQALLRNRMMTSSIDYHISMTPGAARAPAFVGELESGAHLRTWLDAHRPDLILGSRRAYERLGELGYRMPGDFGFASWDVTGMPATVAGMEPRWDLVGREAVRRIVSCLNANELGLPEAPGIVVVDSGFRGGATLGAPVAADLAAVG